MELLRWILLLAGAAFVGAVYLYGRKRLQNKRDVDDDFDDELPAFNARKWDDFVEGVGPVKVISGGGLLAGEETSSTDGSAESSNQSSSDIIILYILPKPDIEFSGSQVNSSVQALGLKFGEMNIYHYNDEQRSIFSIANMHEPGFFDPETIHELTTTGLTIFMQINTAVNVDAMDDLTEMLQRSYQVAGLLEGILCNHRRKPLTEQDAEGYRQQVKKLTCAEA